MDQIKIGRFIQQQRKNAGITQSELAEMLGVTDRAVSKWENGNCLPDADNILALCSILKLGINDLFSGEIVDMKNNEVKLEENLLEMIRINSKTNKQLLFLEFLIVLITTMLMLVCILFSYFIDVSDLEKALLIIGGCIPFGFSVFYSLKIEQTAGYYECKNCHYRYVPSYKSVLFAMHVNRTRYMKCPKCNKKSWSRKVLSNRIDEK